MVTEDRAHPHILPRGSAAAAPVPHADVMPINLPEELRLTIFLLADRKQSEIHESYPCASFIRPAGLVEFTCLEKAN